MFQRSKILVGREIYPLPALSLDVLKRHRSYPAETFRTPMMSCGLLALRRLTVVPLPKNKYPEADITARRR